MSKVSITKEKLDTLAEAVGAKSGENLPLTIDQMTSAVLGIELVNNQTGGGNPYDSVVFYDYDGSIVASYSKAEFTAMPSNPTHEGLVAQGWNWTKAEIDDYLDDYPDATVNVGQMYITDDGKTRLYVHFEEGRTSPYLGLGVNGTVEVDWGDGSATDTLTGTSESTLQTIQHIYQSGDYVITLTPTSGSFSIFGTFATSYILTKSEATASSGVSAVYTNALKKVELGLNAVIGSYAFQNCYSLSLITIPDSVTSIGSYAFANCYGMHEYHFLSITPPTLVNKNAFSNIPSDCVIYVPSASVEAYKAASNWSNYASQIQGE